MKNQRLTKLIEELKKASKEKKSPVLKRVALDLEKPSRQRRIVNLQKINNYSKDGDFVIVPGKVLGDGVIDKKITVAAYQFSEAAAKKLRDNKTSTLSLDELKSKSPKGANIKIIG
ncbi:50S ribosomal protein L18e [Candidatus Woesearchaeota archaeon]|nr:50S ribosomal protein L18e [Candidatus Woesearchaeota archaeon]